MTVRSTRTERDSFGPIEVPEEHLWGAQTQRSLQYFRISTEKMPPALIRALLIVKRASAQVNVELGILPAKTAEAIVAAADEGLAGGYDGEFPLAVWQTGSGTQTNMNVNEVLANRASEILGGPRGEGRLVHPNDDVNRGQSSNDVFPTAMNVAAAETVTRDLTPALDALQATLAAKAAEFRGLKSLEDFDLVGNGLPSIAADVSVVEELGSDTHVIFPIDAPRLSGAELGLGRETDDEDQLLTGTQTQFNARIEQETLGQFIENAVFSGVPA